MSVYETIILPFVLCVGGYETRSLILRKENKLQVSENKVLRKTLRHKKDEVSEKLRKLHDEEVRDLCRWQSVVRTVKFGKLRWDGHVTKIGET
jgi:hypothetical protein